MKKTALLVTILCLMAIVACKSGNENKTLVKGENPKEIILDTEMVNILFPSVKGELSGGDGAISIQIDKDKNYWLWGDSFIGEVENNTRNPKTSPLIIGNVWSFVDGKTAKTTYRGTADEPLSMVEIGKVNDYPAFLWPMHGFVKNNIVHIFMSRIVKTGEGTGDFYWDGSVYYRLNYPDLTIIDSEGIESSVKTNSHYGYAVFEHDGYYYTYGTSPDGYEAPVRIARTKFINDKLQGWEYFDGANWTNSAEAAKSMQGVDIPVSEQFSVFKHGDKFVLLAQDRFLPEIYSYIADEPEGPWYNKKKLYDEPEASMQHVFLYNAMAHPQYGDGDKLLVSYCVNAKNIPDLFTDVSIYRPRFIWVPYSMILN
ncbi:MAG: DUF4185 domain-containing protein [Prevotellaceae bacterium]|jgi:hypothetical protein|nr:DUF4185 domain-containing protein [Prevotellaceae bacterium]